MATAIRITDDQEQCDEHPSRPFGRKIQHNYTYVS